MRFFDRPSEAVAAGFRPCLKCRPLGTDPVIATAVRLARAIEVTSERRWTADELGEAAALSGRTAASRFEKALGISPRAFRDAVRLRRYKGSLRRGERATMAGLDAGYGGEAQRHEGTRALGMTARAYAKGGAGERIAYAVTDTALGAMVLAATAKGVCLLQLMDDEAAARAKLREEFPHAELMEAEGDAPAFAEAVARFLGGRPSAGPAARPARHGVPASRLGGAARDPAGRDADLRRARGRDRQPRGEPRRRLCQRVQQGRGARPLPPGRRGVGPRRLRGRAGAETEAARVGGGQWLGRCGALSPRLSGGTGPSEAVRGG